jgi:hypothetical protein
MQHMHTVEDQVSSLRSAAQHLTGEGVLAFDVFYPKFDLLSSRMGEEVLEFEWHSDPGSAEVVRRYFRKDSVDKINQIFHFTFIYRTLRAGALILEEAEAFELSYFTYPHLRALFLVSGLEPVAEYGSFARDPLDNRSEQMIFLLRKSRS